MARFVRPGLCKLRVGELMSISRADTARSMMSRSNSTTELTFATNQILYDADGKLPDDLDALEEPIFRHGQTSK